MRNKLPHSKALMMLLALSFTGILHAEPAFLSTLKDTYRWPTGTDAEKAGCNVCHAGPPKRNDFGRAVEESWERTGGDTLTVAAIEAIQNDDTDGDGYTNAEELRQGFLPGDASSTPQGVPRPPIGSDSIADTDQSSKPSVTSSAPELLPKHSFHPAFVHFPVALLLVGFVLDLIGKKKNNSPLAKVGWYNVSIGLVALIPTTITGIAAMLRLGFPLEGSMLVHLIGGIASILFSIASWMLMNRADRPKAYALLAVLAIISVAVTGHFGAEMVFGSGG